MGVAWTRLGTVSVTAGSINVAGVDTRWLTATGIGDAFQGPDGRWYEVAGVTSDTALQLRTPYQGASAAGQAYAIMRIVPQGSDAVTMAQLQQLLDEVGLSWDTLLAWADSQGTVSITDGYQTLPNLSGLRKLMADIAQLVADMAKRPALSAANSLGIGRAPSAWSGVGPGQNAVQTMSWAVSCDVNSHYQTNNAYYAGAWAYIGSKCATRYDQDASAGAHKWFSAPAGQAGQYIPFVSVMSLDGAGALLVGDGTKVAGARSTIKGAAAGIVTALALQNENNDASGSGVQLVFKNSLNGAPNEDAKFGFIRYVATGNYGEQAALVFGTNNGLASPPVERVRIDAAGAMNVQGPIRPGQYTLSTLPAASAYSGYSITVSNASQGVTLCVSNGIGWVNVTTNTYVS